MISIHLSPGTSLDPSSAGTLKAEALISSYPKVDRTSLTVGDGGSGKNAWLAEISLNRITLKAQGYSATGSPFQSV